MNSGAGSDTSARLYETSATGPVTLEQLFITGTDFIDPAWM